MGRKRGSLGREGKWRQWQEYDQSNTYIHAYTHKTYIYTCNDYACNEIVKE